MISIRQRILNRELVVGTWIQTGSPVAAEIAAEAGFAFVAADMEHTDIDMPTFCGIARACQGKTAPMARVVSNDVMAIRRTLDCGAQGVIVPLVNNKAQAEDAVRAAKYPPEGIRGFAFTRANLWGKEFDAYASGANDSIAVIVMIETREAVENIEEILSVKGVDGVFIGPYDLSGSYGVAGNVGHPLVLEAKKRVLTACGAAGKAAGQHLVTPTRAHVAEAIAQGYTFLALGMDTVFISSGAAQMMEMTGLGQ